jgi:hypothetical protein
MIDPFAKLGTNLLTGKKESAFYGTSLSTGMTEAQIRRIKQLSARPPGESLMVWARQKQRGINYLP